MEGGNVEPSRASQEAANAINITNIFCRAYIEVLTKLNRQHQFVISPTFQVIQSIETRHRVSSIIDFTGGINGILIINYSSEAAMDVVGNFLQGMGMAPEDCPKGLGEEMLNILGEITNQVVGNFRKNLFKEFGLHTTSGTPVTMIPNLMLSVMPAASQHSDATSIRAQITTPAGHPFFIELCVQKGLFVRVGN